jgi:hypothetical protein
MVILIPEGHVFIESKNIRKKKTEIKALFYSTFDKNMKKKSLLIHPVYTSYCQVNVTRVALDENIILQNFRKIN